MSKCTIVVMLRIRTKVGNSYIYIWASSNQHFLGSKKSLGVCNQAGGQLVCYYQECLFKNVSTMKVEEHSMFIGSP